MRPLDKVNNLLQNLDVLTSRNARAVVSRLNEFRHRLHSAVNRLETLDPDAILARGFSLAFNRDTGGLISKTRQSEPGLPVDLRVSDGIIKLTVDEENDAQ